MIPPMCSDGVVSATSEQHFEQRPPLVVVVGPTAAGKSALSLDIAEQFTGEIINADSMQLYRGLDIGTAKLPPPQRRGIPHHLLDIWELDHSASVSEYQRLAREAISEIQRRGRLPILVGGSGLYINSVIDDLRFPGTDPLVRARLEQELERIGPAALHDRLAELDPAAAMLMSAGNGRRTVRALEVIELTGAPYTAQLARDPHLPATVIGVSRSRPELDRRISERVDLMWRDGLVEEVRSLAATGLADAPTASRALGYAQVLQFLSGSISESEAREATVAATRRFARRQISWFLRDQRVNWLDAGEKPQAVAQAVSGVLAAQDRS